MLLCKIIIDKTIRVHNVVNDDDQTRKNAKSNHSETQDLTWKTLPMRKVKTTGASQQTLLTIFKSRVTTPYGGFNKSGNPNTEVGQK